MNANPGTLHFDADRAARSPRPAPRMPSMAALCLMASIGHQTGLFDVMASLPPSTVDDIARAAALNARYVREWLGAMVASGASSRYEPSGAIPPARRARGWLTRERQPEQRGGLAQFDPRARQRRGDVVEAFATARACRTRAYPVPRGDGRGDAQTVVAALCDHILPLVPGLAERLGRASTCSTSAAVRPGR